MSIICGIDFSPGSSRSTEVAAAFAERLKQPLHLVHAFSDWPGDVYGDERGNLLTMTRRALAFEAAKFKARGIEVHFQVELDPPERSLALASKGLAGSLLVLGSTGHNSSANRPVGRVADRLAQQSSVSTLVVRAPEVFEQWFAGKRALKVLVGLDFNLISEDAWQWARALAGLGQIELTGAHLYWPPHEFLRLGLGGARSYVDGDEEVERVLRRELETRFLSDAASKTAFKLEPNLGRPAERLLAIAKQNQADLLVVGSHQRSSIERLWEGSVSRGILHGAACSVACVPLRTKPAQRGPRPTQTILVATDFSETGNQAIEYAFSQTPPNGKVFVVHVTPPTPQPSAFDERDLFASQTRLKTTHAGLVRNLRALIPESALSANKQTEIYVLESHRPAEAIAQAAERLGVDLICMGTHGRTAIAKTILGAVTQDLLAHTKRPVLLIHSPAP